MLEPGDVVADKYQVKSMIGRGGMGEVYLVRHALTGRRFALKVLAPALGGAVAASHRLVREALAAGRVEHRNVVDMFDVGEHRGAVYLVMEYLEGRPMSELLETGELSDRSILSILLRAMEGVAAAHEHGIVHRDLKPENIFVCMGPNGALDEPRVMDFGISQLPEQLNTGDTNSGFVVGTPHFMCLEQLQGVRDLDGRVDVYALGVSLYRAFAGRVPFQAAQLTELAQRIAHDVPTPLGALRPDLPQMLTQTIMKAMARQRDDRHPTVRILARDLEPFVAGLSDVPARDRRARAATPTLSLAATRAIADSAPRSDSKSLPESLRSGVPAARTLPAPTRSRKVLPWVTLGAACAVTVLLVSWASEPPRQLESASGTARPAAQLGQRTDRPDPAAVVVTAPAAAAPRNEQQAATGATDLAADSQRNDLEPETGSVVQPLTAQAQRERLNRAVRPPIRDAAPATSEAAQRVRPTAQRAPAAELGTRQELPAGSPEPGYDLLREFDQGSRGSRTLDETDPYAQ